MSTTETALHFASRIYRSCKSKNPQEQCFLLTEKRKLHNILVKGIVRKGIHERMSKELLDE